jgi:hypothetical protein
MGLVDLSPMQAAVSLGDGAKDSGQYGTAVMHYKAAGQIGADKIGPAIDAKVGGATAGLTQAAWDMNGLLAGLNSEGDATSDDADQAKSFISQIMAKYVAANAYAAAPAAHADVKLPPLVATSSILPVYGAMPPLGQALPAPKPVAAPTPVAAPKPAAAPAPVKTYAPPVITIAPKKPAVSGKNLLAAAAMGAGGAALLGLPGAIIGALAGGFGSKTLLKW